MRWGLTWLCAYPAVLLCVALGVVGPQLVERQEGSTVVMLRPEVGAVASGAGALLAVGAALVLLVLALGVAARVHPLLGVAALGTSLVSCAAVFLATVVASPPWWQVLHTVRDRDGATYRLIHQSKWLADTLAFERVEHVGLVFSSGRLLGQHTFGFRDEPPGVPIVRPADAPERGYRHLYASDSGVLVAGWRNQVYVSYDTATGSFGIRPDLSPFILIGPDTVLHPGDVRDLVESVAARRRGDARYSPRPTNAVLGGGFDHPNPEVRALAARLLPGQAEQP